MPNLGILTAMILPQSPEALVGFEGAVHPGVRAEEEARKRAQAEGAREGAEEEVRKWTWDGLDDGDWA